MTVLYLHPTKDQATRLEKSRERGDQLEGIAIGAEIEQRADSLKDGLVTRFKGEVEVKGEMTFVPRQVLVDDDGNRHVIEGDYYVVVLEKGQRGDGDKAGLQRK